MSVCDVRLFFSFGVCVRSFVRGLVSFMERVHVFSGVFVFAVTRVYVCVCVSVILFFRYVDARMPGCDGACAFWHRSELRARLLCRLGVLCVFVSGVGGDYWGRASF